MTTLREAAQQALEAWEHINKYGFVLADYEGPMEQAITALRAALEQPEQDVPETDCGNMQWADIPKEFNDWWDADRLTQTNPFRDDSPAYWAWEGWQARAALAEPEQEPVAWMVYTLDGKSVCVTDNPADFTDEHRVLPLYAHSPRGLTEPVAVAVAWRTFDGEGGYDYRAYDDNENYRNEWDKRNPNHKGWVEPLYTHPPRRECLHAEVNELKRTLALQQQSYEREIQIEVEAEREACAKLVEHYRSDWDMAETIRARGNT